ncbi:forkhead box protein K1-like [Anopheles cruzii]|uniref:forkhead box protein K1-like n=1 Tax=Anopheles cruzii TaxID=68878 RepID=UPI0022EC8692|nr:forkhead box protein K1-like [Anopheles cruzii]
MSGATQECIPSRGNGEVSVNEPEPLVNVPDSNESSPGSSSHNMLVATNYQNNINIGSTGVSSRRFSTSLHSSSSWVSSPSPTPSACGSSKLSSGSGSFKPLPLATLSIGSSVMATVNNSAAGISTTGSSNTANYHNFIGRLISKDNMLLISEDVIEVGRNSSKSLVDFHVGKNSFVSRKHFIIQHDMNDEFTLFCLSKNGVFIDNVFHRKSGEPYKLPKLCSIRFPSTNIKIQFENLIGLANNGIMIDLNEYTPVKITGCPMSIPLQNITSNSVGSGGSSTSTGGALCVSGNKSPSCSVIYAPLKISIPSEQGASGGTGQGLLNDIPRGRCRGSLVGGVSGGSGGRGSDIHGGGGGSVGSGYPSPTGTISAASSCPTSPRQNVHDFAQYSSNHHPHHHHSNISHSTGTNTNNNNYSEFQAPATQSLESDKPSYSYAQLIVQAISASPEKQLTLSGIYSFISKNYPYYRAGANKGWQNSIRHNLSLHRYFIKVPRSQDEPGKGSFWRIDPSSELKLIDQSYRKCRQRGSQCFRSPFGMPRSAPVSPNYTDNSREGSPINEELLLSAPGSPGQNNSSYSANNHDGSQQSSYQNQYVAYASADHHPTEVYEEDEQMEYESDNYEPCNQRQKM